MKLFFEYLKQRRYAFAVGILFYIIFLLSFLLYRLPIEAVIYPFLVCTVIGAVLAVFDFRNVKKKHDTLCGIKSITDVIESPLPEAETVADEDYKEIIRLIAEEHNGYCTESDKSYSDMVDYYTLWAHQIKTPIASMRLNLQNEDTPLSRKLYGDLFRIEQYVEMVLTFLRLNSQDSDYVIKEYDIDAIARQAVKKFSHDFIAKKLSLSYEVESTKIVTDEKWLSFVIEQVLSNALKYTQSGSISIYLSKDKKLSVKDTGIGIAPEDLPRIFEKGYTGFNGRTDKRASGIGLYLCKRICQNLGHGITAESVVDEGTAVTIDLSREKIDFE